MFVIVMMMLFWNSFYCILWFLFQRSSDKNALKKQVQVDKVPKYDQEISIISSIESLKFEDHSNEGGRTKKRMKLKKNELKFKVRMNNVIFGEP